MGSAVFGACEQGRVLLSPERRLEMLITDSAVPGLVPDGRQQFEQVR
jgi:hypothetical protein